MTAPMWMKKPSVPGKWLCLISTSPERYVAVSLRQDDLDRGAPFGSLQAFGPISSPIIEPAVVVPSNVIEWHEQEDGCGNTYWEGDSPLSEDGVPFQWRLRRRLRNDNVVTFVDHDSELMPHVGNSEWDTIGEAKAAIQRIHDNVVMHETQDVSTDK